MSSIPMPNNVLDGWTVLVVDDEPDSLDVAMMLLEMCGAHVLTAVNGQDALDKIRQHKPRFVISDLSMPRMSGWEMLNNLKRERDTSDIPVIALTAHAMEGDRTRAIAAGFHNYLTKPLQPETFASDLLKLLVEIPEIAAQLSRR